METPKDVMSHPIYDEWIKYYKYWKEYPDKLLKFCLEEFNKLDRPSNLHERVVKPTLAEYSIETLEIELNKLKGTVRILYNMQDEMLQNHPSVNSYEKRIKELEATIKYLRG